MSEFVVLQMKGDLFREFMEGFKLRGREREYVVQWMKGDATCGVHRGLPVARLEGSVQVRLNRGVRLRGGGGGMHVGEVARSVGEVEGTVEPFQE